MLDGVELIGARETQAGGEGSDDQGGAGQSGQRCKAQRERDRGDEEDVAHPHAVDHVEQQWGDETPQHHRHHQEPDRDRERPQHTQHRNARARRQSRHHAEDDEPQHIVDHRRADDDASFRSAHSTEIGEDPGGDAD